MVLDRFNDVKFRGSENMFACTNGDDRTVPLDRNPDAFDLEVRCDTKMAACGVACDLRAQDTGDRAGKPEEIGDLSIEPRDIPRLHSESVRETDRISLLF